MLKIKLARFGKKHQPHFRIVVNEAKDKRDGQYVALLGHYAPASQPKLLELNVEAFKAWVAKGAQPTETVANLFERFQSKEPFPARKAQPSKKAKAKVAAEKEAKETAKNAPVETKVSEATPEAEAPVEAAPEVAAETVAVETPEVPASKAPKAA